MNTEPNPPQQPGEELPAQGRQAQQSPSTTPPPADVTPQVGPQGQKKPRALPVSSRVLIIVLAVLLLGGGLLLYTTVYRPAVLHSQATATAQARGTAIAQANATSTAQALATATGIAQDNATVTAVAQANATATAVAQPTVTAQAQATFVAQLLPGPTGTPVPGQWTATANGLGTFTFTVNPASTAITQLFLQFPSVTCDGTIIEGLIAGVVGSWPVSNGKLALDTTSDTSLNLDLAIIGKFDTTGIHAVGIWKVTANGTICPGTWTGNSGG